MSRKVCLSYTIFTIWNYIFLVLVSLVTFLPFYLVGIVSVTDEKIILRDGYQLFPKDFTLDAYRFILRAGSGVVNGYKISLFVTAAGTFLAVSVTCMIAYALSRRKLKYRNKLAFIVYFTMLFNGGIVPWYIIVSKIGIKNSVWALILPYAMNPWNMFIMLNFFKSIPEAIVESAKLDGAGDLRTFITIVIPLSTAGIATITLFYTLIYWNDWWLALMLIRDRDLYPLQFHLRQVLSSIVFATSGKSGQTSVGNIPTESVKMATCIVTIGPIIFVYPFIQKYFVKGITIGALKG